MSLRLKKNQFSASDSVPSRLLQSLDHKVALVEQQPRRPLCVRPEAGIAVHVGHGQQAARAGVRLTVLVVPRPQRRHVRAAHGLGPLARQLGRAHHR